MFQKFTIIYYITLKIRNVSSYDYSAYLFDLFSMEATLLELGFSEKPSVPDIPTKDIICRFTVIK